jgi:hypothetical protein
MIAVDEGMTVIVEALLEVPSIDVNAEDFVRATES